MIIGNRVRLFPIELSASIAENARSVGLIKTRDDYPVGTGFLIDQDLVLTAWHVIAHWKGGIARPKFDAYRSPDFIVDFEQLRDVSDADRSPILDTAPFPWSNAAANELHQLLADAYPNTSARLGILGVTGIPSRLLLHEGTPSATWRQALEVVANLKLLRKLVDLVLQDASADGFHERIKRLVAERAVYSATPIAFDIEQGWGALQLEKRSTLPPLVLGSPKTCRQGDPVLAIQHPGGRHKQFALEPEGMVQVTEDDVLYSLDTERGSSGAPVFDVELNVIAIHFAGWSPDISGEPEREYANRGKRIDLVKRGLSAAGLNFVEPVSPP